MVSSFHEANYAQYYLILHKTLILIVHKTICLPHVRVLFLNGVYLYLLSAYYYHEYYMSQQYLVHPNLGSLRPTLYFHYSVCGPLTNDKAAINSNLLVIRF